MVKGQTLLSCHDHSPTLLLLGVCLKTEVSFVNTADKEDSSHLSHQITLDLCPAQMLEDKLLDDQLENLCVYRARKRHVGE